VGEVITLVYTSVSEEVTHGDRRKETGRGAQPGLGLGALPGPSLPLSLLTVTDSKGAV